MWNSYATNIVRWSTVYTKNMQVDGEVHKVGEEVIKGVAIELHGVP